MCSCSFFSPLASDFYRQSTCMIFSLILWQCSIFSVDAASTALWGSRQRKEGHFRNSETKQETYEIQRKGIWSCCAVCLPAATLLCPQPWHLLFMLSPQNWVQKTQAASRHPPPQSTSLLSWETCMNPMLSTQFYWNWCAPCYCSLLVIFVYFIS